MTLDETEVGRMSIWDKVLTAMLNGGKDVETSIQAAERAVRAFEDRFHTAAEAYAAKMFSDAATKTTENSVIPRPRNVA